MATMFGECNSLASLDLSNFNTTRVSDLGAMFRGCSSLTSLDLSSFNTSNVTSMAFMFCECGIPDLALQCLETASVTNMCGMFSRWSLADLDLSGLDTSGVTDMSHMFSECPRLTNLYLGQFVTSNVTDMSYMFCECPNLTSLDLSHFVTSNVTDMSYMFSGCVQLKKLQLSSFDTTNVTNMHHMFCYCPELENLDVSTFNTSNVTDMECMFESCSLLISLDLSNFVTTNVRSMLWMFEDCSSLVILNIGNFDTSNTEAVDVMLQECDSLCWLMTPKKNSSRIDLPVALYDASGNVHTELPVTSKSILLTKEKSGYIADISKCTITLSPNSYTYTGAPCQPTVKVNSGNQALDRVLTYNVGYQNNLDAGTAVVTVTGVGLCTGVNTASFTIKKANPILDFGIIGSVQKNSTDPPFTIPLILSITDGNILYRSSDPEIAGVNAGNGMVTPHKPGRVRIYADAQEGSNYLSGSTSYELIIVAATPTTASFSDVQDPTHPYYKAIYWAAGAGIAKGYSDGTFGIDNPCTRGEMIMFLWRFAGKPNPKTVSNSPFKDVPKTHTFYKAVLWAYQQGITKGYGNGTFGVNRNVSRGESMMFLWRLKGKKEPTSVSASPFKDVPKTHTFYKAILWGYQKKITTGYTSGPKKGTFGINENCTRGQIVTFLYRAK